MCAAALDDVDAASRASVRVEQAAGPLLLVSGGDDGVWPARRMCELAIRRMTEHGRARDLKHLHFANAGHMLFPYQRPSDTLIPEGLVDLGGSAEADAAAHASAWQKVVETLRG
jgi:dienelactone hydrolase